MAALKTRERFWRKRVQRLRRKENRQGKDPRVRHADRQKTREARRKAEKALARVRSQIHAQTIPLRQRALKIANTLVGVMEQGGNNRGPKVTEIIKANGGFGPEPWCGDFVAYCYRNAGSKAVTRAWAAVALYLGVAGIKRTDSPQAGDPVRFTFSHIGLFVKDNGDGTITTVEGNTGSSGAVSDSATGGDGVYIKRRPKSLVRDYLRVTR